MEKPEINSSLPADKAKLESPEWEKSLLLTLETRARISQLLGNFLLDNSVGRTLVHASFFTHPILKEKEKRQKKICKLADLIRETSPGMDQEAAELIAKTQEDFQPRSPEQTMLECRIDDLVIFRIFSMRHYDPNRGIDSVFNLSPYEIYDRLPTLTPEQKTVMDQLLPQAILSRKVAFIRDRFYQLLVDRDWRSLIELVFCYFQNPEINGHLSQWAGSQIKHISSVPHFRSFLFRFLMETLINQGEEAFFDFGKYWQRFGVDLSNPAEKQQLASEVFPTDLWYSLMNENFNRYIQLQQLLERYGIRPKL